jgi:hypothetical protein
MFEPNDSGWPQISFEFVSIGTPGADSDAGDHLVAAGEFRSAPNILLFKTEPTGDDYQALLRFAASHCYAFALVWQDQLQFHESALQVARRLEPWLLMERRVRQWPGYGEYDCDVAWRRWYEITEGSIAVISEPSGFYHWRSPKLPEDLIFYHSDGNGWVGSISHEGLGWLDLSSMHTDAMRDLLNQLYVHGVIALPGDENRDEAGAQAV